MVQVLKKLTSVGCCLAILMTYDSVFGQENDFFELGFGARAAECKNHFDIEPYLAIAVGGEIEGGFSEEVIESLVNFSDTGRLTLPTDLQNDPIAVHCAVYAEGILVGATAVQMIQVITEMLSQGLAEGLERLLEELADELSRTLKDDRI